jgi:hypothetical protein
MNTRILLILCAIAGIAASLIYMIATIVGGFITPNYSHISNSVSALIARGQPYKPLLDTIFLPYNMLLVPFAYGLYLGIKDSESGKGSKVGSIAMAVAGILGIILTLFFPLDPGETIVSFTGMMHVVVVSIITLLLAITILATGLKARKDPEWSAYLPYSFARFVALIISGIGTTLTIGGQYGGVTERISIGILLQWIFVMAMKLLTLAERGSRLNDKVREASNRSSNKRESKSHH